MDNKPVVRYTHLLAGASLIVLSFILYVIIERSFDVQLSDFYGIQRNNLLYYIADLIVGGANIWFFAVLSKDRKMLMALSPIILMFSLFMVCQLILSALEIVYNIQTFTQ